MPFELELQTGSHGWPRIIDKARGMTVDYRGPQPDGVTNILLHTPDGDFEACVHDDTNLESKPELDVLWTVQSIRPAAGAKKDAVAAALKEALEALSFRKQAIKMREVPVVKSVTVDFSKTIWA